MTKVSVFIFLVFYIGYSCVKPKTTNPVPVLEYIEFAKAGKSVFTGQDTANLVIAYEDGDGDIFRDSKSNDPNMVFIPYAFYDDSNKYVKGTPFTYVLTQPLENNYKGKSIKGEIIVPFRQIRPNDKIKKIKYEFFMLDMKNNKSNVVITPDIILNF
jgi:hypothetical protein